MGKVKRFLTEQEDQLLSELRRLQNGKLDQEAIEAAVKAARSAVEAVRERQEIETAIYELGDQSVHDFMLANYGLQAADDQGDAPAQTIVIEFV